MRIIILILLVTGILIHAWGSRRWSMPSNQQLLQQQAVGNLSSDDKFSQVSVEFSLLDGRVGGQVPSAEAREQAWAVIQKSVAAGRLFDHLEVVAPRDQPARIVITAAGGIVTFRGVVGDSSLKEAVTAGLGAGRAFRDELVVSERVREPLWAGRVGELVARYFGQIADGALELGEREFVLRGRIKGEKARDALIAGVRAFLPEGGTLRSELQLLPDQPASVLAQRDGNRIRLSGKLPSGDAIASLLQALNLPAVQVEHQLQGDARVETPTWAAAFPAFLSGFFRDGTGAVELQGKQLTLRGERPASKGRAQLDSLLQPMRQAGCEVRDLVQFVPDLEPVFRARLADGTLQLSGRLPNESIRGRILAGAGEVGAARLDSQLKVEPAVRSAPWLESLPGLLKAFFAKRQAGELVFDGNTWRVLGEIEGPQARETLLADIAKLVPPGVTLDPSGLRLLPVPVPMPVPVPPPVPGKVETAPWLVVQFGSGEWRIEGQVLEEADRKTLTAAVEPKAPGIKLSDGLKVAPDTAKAPWVGPISRFLPKFGAMVSEGRLELRNGKLTLSGEALDPKTRDSLLAELAAALPNELVKVEDKMTVRQSGAQADSAPTFVIYFNAGSDWIRPDGRLEIDKAAAAASALPPGSTVLVKGFADARGDAMSNLKLSELRAEAVRQSLLQRGLAEKSLELIGVGDREANQGRSEEVWSKDRRVEIIAVRK